MLVFYVLLRSCLTYSKGYDLHRRFAAIFCVLGVCMACLVMLDYAVRWQEFLQVHTTLYLKYRNFATALLLTTLPMSFYLSLKKPAHLLGVAVQAAGLALTGSRSALLRQADSRHAQVNLAVLRGVARKNGGIDIQLPQCALDLKRQQAAGVPPGCHTAKQTAENAQCRQLPGFQIRCQKMYSEVGQFTGQFVAQHRDILTMRLHDLHRFRGIGQIVQAQHRDRCKGIFAVRCLLPLLERFGFFGKGVAL